MKAFTNRQLGHFVQLHTSNWYQGPEPECRAVVITPMFCSLYAPPRPRQRVPAE